MAILAQCPYCKRKQKIQNKVCKGCGEDLDKAKAAKKVRYWIDFEVAGKQRREAVGFSIEEARDADGKRRAQKREGRIFEILPQMKMTFNQLAEWYIDLESVKALASFDRVRYSLKNLKPHFGNLFIKDIKPTMVEDYQQKRLRTGVAPATVDREVGELKTMIRKANGDGKVDDRLVWSLSRVKKLLKRGANARDMVLSAEEFDRMVSVSPPHLLAILATAFYTGMRRGEILSLTWNKVDLQKRTIRLEASDTKDKEPRVIPICDQLYEILASQPRALHHNAVFLYFGKPITDNFKRSLISTLRKAEIPYGRKVKGGFCFHDFRHCFVTNMRRAGVAESVIMKITGHSTSEMFHRYNSVDADDAAEAMAKLDGFLNDKKSNGAESQTISG